MLLNINVITHTNQPTNKPNTKMSFQLDNQMSSSQPEPQPKPLNPQQFAYPSVQCKNPVCYRWAYAPNPGSKCVECMEVLPIWVGYLNADKDNEPYIPSESLKRTDTQEMWFYDETPRFLERTNTDCIDELIDCDPPQLKPADDNDHEHLTNAERVVREISLIYGVDREGAIKQLDHMAKTAVVEYF
jgi:hypothetical protein